jgi:hypothetical protein
MRPAQGWGPVAKRSMRVQGGDRTRPEAWRRGLLRPQDCGPGLWSRPGRPHRNRPCPASHEHAATSAVSPGRLIPSAAANKRREAHHGTIADDRATRDWNATSSRHPDRCGAPRDAAGGAGGARAADAPPLCVEQEQWLAHHGEAAAYIGPIGYDECRRKPRPPCANTAMQRPDRLPVPLPALRLARSVRGLRRVMRKSESRRTVWPGGSHASAIVSGGWEYDRRASS